MHLKAFIYFLIIVSSAAPQEVKNKHIVKEYVEERGDMEFKNENLKKIPNFDEKELEDLKTKLLEIQSEKINAEKDLTDANFKITKVKDELEVEKKRADKAELSVKTLQEYQSTSLKKIEEDKKFLQGQLDKTENINKELKQQLSQEIEHSKELENTKSFLETTMKNVTSSLNECTEKYDILNDLHNEALEHLANPKLSEYLQAQGRQIGQMRPELKAAIEKVGRIVEPHVDRAFRDGAAAYKQAADNVERKVSPYVGEDRAWHITLGIFVLVMLLPAFVLYKFFHGLKNRIRFYHVVMCINFWGMSFFAAVLMTSVNAPYGKDSFYLLQKYNQNTYTTLQLCCAFFFVSQVGLSSIIACNCSSRRCAFTNQIIHFVSSIGILVHYYWTIWSKAMLDQSHEASLMPFGIYIAVFAHGIASAYQFGTSKSIRESILKKNID